MPFSGSRLKLSRIEAGFRRQKDLSEKLEGISPKMISDYERGKELPRADVLIQLARAVKRSTDYLCGETDVKEPLTISQMKGIVEYSVMELFRSERLDVAKLKLAYELRNLPESRYDEIVRLLKS